MKTKFIAIFHLLSAIFVPCFAQGTAFTYQGRLNDGANPATGSYDLRFAIYDSTNQPGTLIAGPLTNSATVVSNGLFTVTLDFGAGVFDGSVRWLDVAVRTSGAGPFSPLNPRQLITLVPYALRAQSAGSLPAGGVTSAMLADGAVTSNKLAPGAVSQLGVPGTSGVVLQVGTNGLIGIGTTTPATGLQISDGSLVYGFNSLFRLQDGMPGYSNLGWVIDVAVNGSLAAIAANSDSSVTLVDISNPSAPQKRAELTDGVGGFNDLAYTFGVALSTNNLLAIAAYSDNAVSLVDVSNPSSPVLRAVLKDGVGGFNDLNAPVRVTFRGNLLVVSAGGDNAVSLVDVSTPTSPQLLSVLKNGQGVYTNLNSPFGIAFSANNLMAVAAFQSQAVNLVDISNPQAPVLHAVIRQGQGGFNNIGQLEAVAFKGNTLAIGGWNAGAVTFADVSNPDAPQLLSVVTGMSGIRSVAFQGNLLAVAAAAANEVALIDAADFVHPVVRGVFRDLQPVAQYSEGLSSLAFTPAGYLLVGSGYNSSAQLLQLVPNQASLSTSGWVGIGTTKPNAPLHVVGNVQVDSADYVSLQANHVELGFNASAGGAYATAEGNSARADADYSTVSGGLANRVTASGINGVISGGLSNLVSGSGATIGGGFQNTAGGSYATVAGGLSNSAAGFASFAAGHRARANHDGTFVWADAMDADFASSSSNQFLIRAAGGVGVGSTNPQASLHIYSTNNPTVVRIQSTGTPGFGRVEFVSNPQGDINEWRPGYIQSLDAGNFTGGLGFYLNGTGNVNKFGTNEVMRMINGNVGIGTNTPQATLHIASSSGFSSPQLAITQLNTNDYARLQIGVSSFPQWTLAVQDTAAPQLRFWNGTVDVAWLNNNGAFYAQSFNPTSDRNAKENFRVVKSQAVLEKVAALPISEWNFKTAPGETHIGPMAQDFHAAFGLNGGDDKHIATVDADGVALAAIQGLNQMLVATGQQSESRIQKLEAENADLKQKNDSLEKRLDALEQIILNHKSN